MKKFLSLLLTLTLVLSLAACGAKDTPPPAPDAGDAPETPPPAEEVTITVAALASGYEEAYPGRRSATPSPPRPA